MFCYDKNLLFTGTVSPLYKSKIRVLLTSNGLEHVHLFVIELEHRIFGFEQTDVEYWTWYDLSLYFLNSALNRPERIELLSIEFKHTIFSFEQTDIKHQTWFDQLLQKSRKIFRGFDVVVVPSCSTSSSTWRMYDPISPFFPVLSSLKISLLGRHKHFKFFVCMTESKWYVSHEETCHVIWCHLPESQPLRCFKVEKKMRGLKKKETLSSVATT